MKKQAKLRKQNNVPLMPYIKYKVTQSTESKRIVPFMKVIKF